MPTCIFCKIIEGSIPAEIVYEDEHAIAFMDIMPLTEGHTLLIPKKHCENVYELSEEEASNLLKVVPKIANVLKETFKPSGLNLLQNNGSFAGQSVFHFHLHFIPRYDETDGIEMSWNPKIEEYTPEKIKGIAEKVREQFQSIH